LSWVGVGHEGKSGKLWEESGLNAINGNKGRRSMNNFREREGEDHAKTWSFEDQGT